MSENKPKIVEIFAKPISKNSEPKSKSTPDLKKKNKRNKKAKKDKKHKSKKIRRSRLIRAILKAESQALKCSEVIDEHLHPKKGRKRSPVVAIKSLIKKLEKVKKYAEEQESKKK